MYSLQFQVSLMRFFRRIKATFADAFTIDHDLHKPLSLVRANAKKPGFVGFGWFAHVLQVSKTCHFSKVVKFVVVLVSVFVVNMSRRKNTGHIQPRQTMRESFFVVDRNSPVAGICWTPCTFADKIRAAFVHFPHKLACVWVVVKDGSDMVSGNHDIQFTIGAAK